MSQSHPVIEVFGADIICASCVNAPSSKDTYEWLQAAISRKYPEQPNHPKQMYSLSEKAKAWKKTNN